MVDLLALTLIVVGLFFFAIGTLGLLRLPDLHSRLHALTKADNIGLGLLALGVVLLDGSWQTGLKLLLVWLLVLFASSSSAHAIARYAGRRRGGQ